MRTLIGLDAGTTGVTAVLFDDELSPVASSAREFQQHFPRPGWVEHEAGDILAAVDAVLGELLGRPEAADVAALGITNQRETVFALERGGTRALRRGIVWQDRRTAARCGELAATEAGGLVRRRTGLLLDPYFSATKIEWMLREDPAVARRARAGEVVFATVDALVVAHLTGGAVVATDPTNACRTMLFDVDERAFAPELAELFGVEVGWLPEVRPSRGDFGVTRPERAGGREIPLRAVVGDQQAALFGQGCFGPGSFKVTFGTGSFLLLNTGERRVDSRRGLITTLALDVRGEPCWSLEGSVFVCGALVQWLRDAMGAFPDAAGIEALAREVEDAGGVVVVPAFAGLGAPYWDAGARGAILGLTRGTRRSHVARAALEAMAFQNAELIEILREESGMAIDSLLADGGAARNDLLMQMQADLSGARVERPAEVEATARGAALLAGLAAGLWDDPRAPAGAGGGARRERFEAGLDEARRRERLGEWRDAVVRVRTTGSR